MYILSVIPIKRGIPFSTLTYYSSDNIAMGTLVHIPLGKQVILGLVYSSSSLIEAKTEIKQATFSLKKIKAVIGTSSFSEHLVTALKEASTRTLVPIGSLAASLIHEMYFDVFEKLSATKDLSAYIFKPEKSSRVASYGTFPDRIDRYKRMIRSTFADKKSVLVVAPTIREVHFWYDMLKKGIPSHSVLLHGKCTKKDQKKTLSSLLNYDKPLLICTTPSFALIPRNDISVCILEHESSTLYKTHDRYEMDLRIPIEFYASSNGMQLVLGDTLPRFETLYQTNSLNIARAFTPEHLVLVPTEKYPGTLPIETIELIRYCKKHKKSMCIYTNRKGIAPLSRCRDCSTIVTCTTCSLPMVLRYKTVEGRKERIFICTHCGETFSSTYLCAVCNSWNIIPLSIGTESVREAVLSLIDEEHIVTIDDDVSLDISSIDTLIESIQKKKWFVMIGTQKIIPFIKQVDYMVIPFFDRMLSIPSPYAVEEALRLIMELNEHTKEDLVVCTQKLDFPIIKQLKTKKIQEIITDDLDIRKALGYPPFGILLKVSFTIPPTQYESTNALIVEFFKEYSLTKIPPRRISLDSMKILGVWIVQVDEAFLEDKGEDLSVYLSHIRYPSKIEINPIRL